MASEPGWLPIEFESLEATCRHVTPTTCTYLAFGDEEKYVLNFALPWGDAATQTLGASRHSDPPCWGELPPPRPPAKINIEYRPKASNAYVTIVATAAST